MSNFIQRFYGKSPFLKSIYHSKLLSHVLKPLGHTIMYIDFKGKALMEYMSTVPRSFGIDDNKFLPLKRYKNMYKGKRCFILCTGPSLTLEDIESLRDEYVFGMNSICLIHDKTNWKPDFFAIQDPAVYDKVQDTLLKTDNGQVFVPSGFAKRYCIPSDWVKFPICGSYHLYEAKYGTRYFAKFSDDCYIRVYDGYSITYSIMQLAVYMGFEEIYLLGADCSYLGEKQHFIEHGHYASSASSATERLFASYGEAKRYAENNGKKIFNATRGGKLELFPRVQLEDVLANQQKNKKESLR